MMDKKITLGIGVFIILAVTGTIYLINPPEGYDFYECDDLEGGMYCWKLSKINSQGLQTRCYWNISAPKRYKVCNTGWYLSDRIKIEGKEVVLSDIDSDQKQALEKVGTGIIDFEVSEMVCDGKLCKVNIFKKGAINKDIRIAQYWTNCTESNCTEYVCVEEDCINKEIIFIKGKPFINCLEYGCIKTECIRKECLSEEKIYLTDEELFKKRDKQINSILKNIANIRTERDAKNIQIKSEKEVVQIK